MTPAYIVPLFIRLAFLALFLAVFVSFFTVGYYGTQFLRVQNKSSDEAHNLKKKVFKHLKWGIGVTLILILSIMCLLIMGEILPVNLPGRIIIPNLQSPDPQA